VVAAGAAGATEHSHGARAKRQGSQETGDGSHRARLLRTLGAVSSALPSVARRRAEGLVAQNGHVRSSARTWWRFREARKFVVTHDAVTEAG